MYEFVFQRSAKLQRRLAKEDVSQTEEDTSQTTAVLDAYEDDALAALTVEPPTPYDSDGGSGWNKMFGLPVGWLKRNGEPKKDASPQDPIVTDPEPTPEDEVATPIIDNTDPVPETPTPAPEPDPTVEEPTPGDEVATPITDNTDPVPETPTPAPEPDLTVDEPAPEPTAPEPTDSVSGPSELVDIDRQIAPTTMDSNSAISVGGGRVTTFVLADAASITGVTVNSLPEYGNVTVNPDFTLALVLSGTDYAGPLSFDYTITRSDGTTETQTATLDVTTPTQAAGWGLGNHYMLETNVDDRLVVEHGDNHRKVYISNSEDALTRKNIADLNGIDESMITKTWLRNNPEYGSSEDTALAADVGMELWYSITSNKEAPSSNWLLFERGYVYEDTGRLVGYGSNGESNLAPIHITAWGSGDKPIVGSALNQYQLPSSNFVIQDIELAEGARILGGTDMIFDGVKLGAETNLQDLDGSARVTFRSSEFVDIHQDAPLNSTWHGHTDREAGIYAAKLTGLLIEKSLFLHNGWAENYDGTIDQGHPPSQYSHNAYINASTTDVTFRDNISAQAASIGASLAGGAFAERNLFLDNNVGVSINATGVETGNFTLFLDNLITSAGHKDSASPGALDWGISDNGRQTTYYRNIVAHSANPEDTAEIAIKGDAGWAFRTGGSTPFFNDTLIHNWRAEQQSIGDLDPATLNQITIQNFAMEFLGLTPETAPTSEDMGLYYKSGLIYALMDYARQNWGDSSLTASDIITYFQAGFNIAATATGDTYHRFIPNDLGDGVRWDNRLNWTSDALPSDGDTVELGGNWVNFSDTVKLNSLDLGVGGKLQVGSGKLTVDALETGDNGMIFVERAGQVWIDGYADNASLSLQVTGGRFANTGDISGTVTASVQGGQMILAADNAQFALGQDSKLRIDGTTAKVGFDGAEGGIATLVMQNGGQLSFVASADGLGRVNEFRSGAWDQDGSNVRSGIVLDGSLALDLSDYIGTGSMKLMEVDAIAGMFDNLDIHGLGDNRDAQLVIDYAADLITLELSSGTGQSSLSIRGDAFDGTDEDADLWDQLTAELDQSGDLDASITIFDDVIDALPEMTFI